jgi:hypothetical protein
LSFESRNIYYCADFSHRVYGSISDRNFIHQETIIDHIRPRIDYDYEKMIEFEVLVMEIPILNIDS